MPRRKISLDDLSINDAFEVFKRHGLHVTVDAVQPVPETPSLADFLEPPVGTIAPSAQQVSSKKVRIVLYAQHSIASGGSLVKDADGQSQIADSSMQTYGPGEVTVPSDLAKQLLHQDYLARKAEADLHNPRMITRVITPAGSGQFRATKVSEDGGFDVASYLVRLGENQMF